MDFFNRVGKKAIGSRLRRLSEQITSEAAEVYQMYHVDLQPKWFPVFYVLSEGADKTITSIATEIGHSHPSVSKIIREMVKKGLVKENNDKNDGRRNVVSLTIKGQEITPRISQQYQDVNEAIEEIFSQTKNDLWKAIEEWEFLLGQKTLKRRVLEKKKLRESSEVEIVDYSPKFKKAFRELNIQWITTYFKMEKADHLALDNPKGYIIDKGGHILIALYNNEPVGVCALIKMKDPEFDFELAKMAVAPEAQGRNIGYLLGMAVIQKARSLGAKNLYLETNTKLQPAVNLYHKLGFQKIAGHYTPYERSNLQMSLKL